MARTEQTLFDHPEHLDLMCRHCGEWALDDDWDSDDDTGDYGTMFCPNCGKEDVPLAWDAQKGRWETKEETPGAWIVYKLIRRGACVNGEKPKKRRRPAAPQSLPGREEAITDQQTGGAQ